MVVTFQTINKIAFPVFVLGSDNWDVQDGLVYLDGLILDDRNIKANTLGKRRLLTPYKNIYQLKRGIINHTGILKQNKNSFIDNKGTLFTYEKTKFVTLKYLKIVEDMLYAGVLHLHEQPWLLYEYAATKLKDTKRKI